MNLESQFFNEIIIVCTGVCKIYEEYLKRENPNTPTITYDIKQLFDFLDNLTDLSCLVYQKSTNTYAPYNKNWIKDRVHVLLRRAAELDDKERKPRGRRL